MKRADYYMRDILKAQESNDRELFEASFQDLATALREGDTPPRVTSLGECEVNTMRGVRRVPREIIACHPHYAIMTQEPGNLNSFVFVVYNVRGEEIERYNLAQ